jgi:glycosyltransferase involved in cell wall biosynthesis
VSVIELPETEERTALAGEAPLYFSVVVPTFNRLDKLMLVIDALGRQVGAPPFEVIVVDDGSSDDTAGVMLDAARQPRFFELRFVSQPNSGPGRARNHGASLARGRLIVFIGDDTIPEPQFLAEHARSHRESGEDPLLACLGYTGWPDGERVTPFMEYINDYGLQFGYRLIEDGAIVPFNFFYTSNISLDRRLMQENPFDTSFPSAAWEDIELAWRLETLGLRIRYNARAVTRHHHPMTVDSFARRQYTVGRSGAIFGRMHPELSHFLGIHELREKGLASQRTVARLTLLARAGERFRILARPAVFERLMRQHYLRGLRDGLAEIGSDTIAPS